MPPSYLASYVSTKLSDNACCDTCLWVSGRKKETERTERGRSRKITKTRREAQRLQETNEEIDEESETRDKSEEGSGSN